MECACTYDVWMAAVCGMGNLTMFGFIPGSQKQPGYRAQCRTTEHPDFSFENSGSRARCGRRHLVRVVPRHKLLKISTQERNTMHMLCVLALQVLQDHVL